MKICVLGAGVIGVTTAYELAKRGHDVTVIEREHEPARQCSYANGGQLSYSASEPWANPHVFPKLLKWAFEEDAPLVLRFQPDIHQIRWGLLFLLNCLPARARRHDDAMLRLGLYSRDKFHELFADTNIECERTSTGILHVFSKESDLAHARKNAAFAQKRGCGELLVDAARCVELEPVLAHSDRPIIGGLHIPIDESGDIYLFTTRLARLIQAKYGVKFRYNTVITRAHKKNGVLSHLTLSNGEQLSGFDHYVMSCGAYSPIYLRQLGLYVPIYPMKGYTITFPANEFCPTMSITDSTIKQVTTRLGDRVRVAGTAEFAGYDHSIRKVRIDPLLRGTRKLFPKADLSNVEEWACLRPTTPDGPPMIGATPLANLSINSGHGTLGWTQAAGSARIHADLLSGKTPEISMGGLDFARSLIRIG